MPARAAGVILRARPPVVCARRARRVGRRERGSRHWCAPPRRPAGCPFLPTPLLMAETAAPAYAAPGGAVRARRTRTAHIVSEGDAPADVIVIGAGLAGLTAGCLLARAGQRVEVHEQHLAPGGYATTLTRRARDGTRYVFDVSPHSISGLAAGGLVPKHLGLCGV